MAVQNAKARFSELLDLCERESPQVVTRRGVEAGVLVPIGEVAATWNVMALDARIFRLRATLMHGWSDALYEAR